MTTPDKYASIAARYDRMIEENPARAAFFRSVFDRFQVRDVLDCACGTGSDLLLFQSIGRRVTGSDLSPSMLEVARATLKDQAAITLAKADFHDLKAAHGRAFDAVVCLSNSINEVEVNASRALRSMKEVLTPGGIIVFDQGQTDFTMRTPPAFAPIVNDSELSRLFTMDYRRNVMTVRMFDFVHRAAERDYSFSHGEFRIRIRLRDEWEKLLRRSGLKAEFYGSWNGDPYRKDRSERLIAVARGL
jgi:ubiquinone/menaquinone biosynthesis C-methylase UbiE